MRELAEAASGLGSPVGSFERDHRRDAHVAALVGAEPVDKVVMMEDHDGAYYAWQQAGIHGRILLHIDAHIDWAWIADRDPLDILDARSLTQVEAMLESRGLWNLSRRKNEELIHIGNYIRPALQQGIVKEFYWVAPDSFVKNLTGLRNLVLQFQRLKRINPRAMGTVTLQDNRVVAEIEGSRVTACGLADLPEIHEPVLLDIDTDFLLPEPDDLLRSGTDLGRQLPWIWPDELLRRLRDKGVRTDFVTIAYSVEGGFTALHYKYLGDELALRLKTPQPTASHFQALSHKRLAASHRHHGDPGKAVNEFERALKLAPADAASHFNLAYLHDAQNAFDRAAACYQEAVRLDPTYATAYNNFGPLYQSMAMPEHAQKEYQRILRWDPQNVEARFGLAETLAQQDRWEDALREHRTVLAARPDHAPSHLGIGRLSAKRGLFDDAISHLTRAVALQPRNGAAHLWLGNAWFHLERWDEAMTAYREAIRCGTRPGSIYARLGYLYLRKRNFTKAWKHYRTSLRSRGMVVLAVVRNAVQNAWQTLLHALDRGRTSCWR